MLEWEHGVVASDTLFDGAVVSFDFGYVFVARGDVESSVEVSQFATHGFELVVGKDDGNAKTASYICANDSFKMLDDMAIFHCLKFTS